MNAFLTCHPDGTCTGLYTELIDLSSIGTLSVTRASEVEFNNDRQVWEVKVQGSTLYVNYSRLECLAWEQQHFNQ